MNSLFLTKDFYLNAAPSPTELQRIRQARNVAYSVDYIEFIQKADGGEGKIGESAYLAIWTIDDCLQVNEQNEAQDSIPVQDFWIFGSSGGTFHYGFHKGSKGIYELDMYEDEYKVYVGSSLDELVKFVYNKNEE
ncbi:SMI1/KNR4 family protein [Hymenobacter norwichensis]|uniref:SMI1/KNR4 family protein n=1 Tax=Hymenobacter norwichensis TaxID=223903 RepID=UPI0012FC824E|nr:SMI1/KNR4 family protein [Hymenobacter norwichensis]